ncbi:hypothetical protein NP233_g8810 [Leucocoprinus birnbaumii]|uniref:C2H2-type domain-containing protein n=1 Tax=Leucocoprinus birnbaumii TaxID=56174 RepID=A0AAD5VQ46_9AGAR|nr:hypothetical protein NP233_g8810 [Leucocoprinus birnbaumii]
MTDPSGHTWMAGQEILGTTGFSSFSTGVANYASFGSGLTGAIPALSIPPAHDFPHSPRTPAQSFDDSYCRSAFPGVTPSGSISDLYTPSSAATSVGPTTPFTPPQDQALRSHVQSPVALKSTSLAPPAHSAHLGGIGEPTAQNFNLQYSSFAPWQEPIHRDVDDHGVGLSLHGGPPHLLQDNLDLTLTELPCDATMSPLHEKPMSFNTHEEHPHEGRAQHQAMTHLLLHNPSVSPHHLARFSSSLFDTRHVKVEDCDQPDGTITTRVPTSSSLFDQYIFPNHQASTRGNKMISLSNSGGLRRTAPTSEKTRQAAEKKRKRPQKFYCDLCGHGFTSRQNLNNHYNSHSGESPYKCAACGKLYRHSRSFNRHYNAVHGNPSTEQGNVLIHIDAIDENPYPDSLSTRVPTSAQDMYGDTYHASRIITDVKHCIGKSLVCAMLQSRIHINARSDPIWARASDQIQGRLEWEAVVLSSCGVPSLSTTDTTSGNRHVHHSMHTENPVSGKRVLKSRRKRNAHNLPSHHKKPQIVLASSCHSFPTLYRYTWPSFWCPPTTRMSNTLDHQATRGYYSNNIAIKVHDSNFGPWPVHADSWASKSDHTLKATAPVDLWHYSDRYNTSSIDPRSPPSTITRELSHVCSQPQDLVQVNTSNLGPYRENEPSPSALSPPSSHHFYACSPYGGSTPLLVSPSTSTPPSSGRSALLTLTPEHGMHTAHGLPGSPGDWNSLTLSPASYDPRETGATPDLGNLHIGNGYDKQNYDEFSFGMVRHIAKPSGLSSMLLSSSQSFDGSQDIDDLELGLNSLADMPMPAPDMRPIHEAESTDINIAIVPAGNAGETVPLKVDLVNASDFQWDRNLLSPLPSVNTLPVAGDHYYTGRIENDQHVLVPGFGWGYDMSLTADGSPLTSGHLTSCENVSSPHVTPSASSAPIPGSPYTTPASSINPLPSEEGDVASTARSFLEAYRTGQTQVVNTKGVSERTLAAANANRKREAKFHCEICGNSQTSKQNLENHVLSRHMQVKRFLCPVDGCSAKYGHARGVNRHLDTKHPGHRQVKGKRGPSKRSQEDL